MNETDEPRSKEVLSATYMPRLAADELRSAWRAAVRSYNTCENAGLTDSCRAIADIVMKISQQLEYAETALESSQ